MAAKTTFSFDSNTLPAKDTMLGVAGNYNIPMYVMPGYVAPAQPGTTEAPVEPVSEPTYAKATENFGTMRHVEPIRDHLINAFLTLEKLRLFASSAPGTEAPLLLRVEKYLQDHLGEAEFTALMDSLGVKILAESGIDPGSVSFVDPKLKESVSNRTKILSARFFSQRLPKIGAVTKVSLDDVAHPAESKNIDITHNAHSALFAAGAVMTDDIRTMEGLRYALVKLRRDQQQELERKQAELAELERRIQDERTTLNGLEAKRSEALDDYSVAQRLLAEHWQEVEAAYADRRRIIESNVGLYYVRVRETPLSRTLPDPLDLRPGDVSDLVPGCPSRPTPLPEELHPFMDTVRDIPAADWAVLSILSNQLPGRLQLEQMVLKRRQTIEIRLKTPTPSTVSHPTLTSMLFNHQAMIQTIAARPFAVAALRDMQQEGHRILALDDMLVSPIPALRDPATRLHQSLTAAAGCLLSRLRAIKPSIRLAWAGLADANRLMVESPERWPNLDQAEADDFNNLRTLVELVGWWFRQLDRDASGESRTALRNFIRACLLLAASDEPQQLLQGRVQSLPSRFLPGELLRLDLNREPAAGNLLQLLDDRQQVVATVRVEDHDDKGTLASIATIINPDISLSLAMRVTGQRN